MCFRAGRHFKRCWDLRAPGNFTHMFMKSGPLAGPIFKLLSLYVADGFVSPPRVWYMVEPVHKRRREDVTEDRKKTAIVSMSIPSPSPPPFGHSIHADFSRHAMCRGKVPTRVRSVHRIRYRRLSRRRQFRICGRFGDDLGLFLASIILK